MSGTRNPAKNFKTGEENNAVVIGLIVGIFAGGFGGYMFGAKVQKKAEAVIEGVKK